MSKMLGLAFGVPELGKGVTEGVKSAKTEKNKITNKYDAKLGVSAPRKPKLSDTIKLAKKLSLGLEKEAEEYEPPQYIETERKGLSPLTIGGMALGASLLRGRAKGNMMQVPFHDIPDIAKKVFKRSPGFAANQMKKSRNPNTRAIGKGLDRHFKKGKGNVGADGGIMGGVKSGLGWMGASIGIERLMSANADPQEKTAAEYKGKAGYARKLIREGILHPGIQAAPIYAAPAVLSYAINKDIKSDFSPVRDMSEEDKKKKNNSQTDYSSRNSAVVNNAILRTASEEVDLYFEKLARGIKAPKTPKSYHVKDWKEFGEELPIVGLRSVSLAVPLTLLANSDPGQTYKQNRAEAEAKKQEKALLRKAKAQQQRELKKNNLI